MYGFVTHVSLYIYRHLSIEGNLFRPRCHGNRIQIRVLVHRRMAKTSTRSKMGENNRLTFFERDAPTPSPHNSVDCRDIQQVHLPRERASRCDVIHRGSTFLTLCISFFGLH